MKTRDDFIKNVWEKAENARAAETVRRKQRRKVYTFAAAAACIALVVGVTMPQDLQEAADQAYRPEVVYNSTVTMNDGVTDDGTGVPADAMDGSAEGGADKDMADQNVAMPGMTFDGAIVTEKLDDKELYKELREQTKDADKVQSSDTQDQLMAYYCLPVGVIIESSVQPEGGFAMYAASEEEVLKYMKWFYNLPEEQVLTTEEFNNLKEIPTGYYKFTMDCSWGADTEGVDRVFWITGKVDLP